MIGLKISEVMKIVRRNTKGISWNEKNNLEWRKWLDGI